MATCMLCCARRPEAAAGEDGLQTDPCGKSAMPENLRDRRLIRCRKLAAEPRADAVSPSHFMNGVERLHRRVAAR